MDLLKQKRNRKTPWRWVKGVLLPNLQHRQKAKYPDVLLVPEGKLFHPAQQTWEMPRAPPQAWLHLTSFTRGLSKMCCRSPSEGGWTEPSFNFHFKGRGWEQSKPNGICLKPTCSVSGCSTSFLLRATLLLLVTLSRLGQDRPAGTGPRGRSKTHATHSSSFHTFLTATHSRK